jgi:hypothetical protein
VGQQWAGYIYLNVSGPFFEAATQSVKVKAGKNSKSMVKQG